MHPGSPLRRWRRPCSWQGDSIGWRKKLQKAEVQLQKRVGVLLQSDFSLLQFSWWILPQPVRPLKFLRQLFGVEILSNMRQALFDFQERVRPIVVVGDRDIAPH